MDGERAETKVAEDARRPERRDEEGIDEEEGESPEGKGSEPYSCEKESERDVGKESQNHGSSFTKGIFGEIQGLSQGEKQMKFNKKAGVPIGTIAIIIIVLIATLGMWWFFTQDRGPDCPDVIHTRVFDAEGNFMFEYWYILYHPKPSISYPVKSYPGPVIVYRLFYDAQGFADYQDLDAMLDDLDNLPISETTIDRIRHIVECIRADCPSCIERVMG